MKQHDLKNKSTSGRKTIQFAHNIGVKDFRIYILEQINLQ